MSDESSQKRDFAVSAQIEAAGMLQEIVGPVAPGAGAVKAAIRRASVLTGLSPGRTRSLWYGAARVWSEEMDLLRAKAAKAREVRDNGTRKQAAEVEAEIAVLRRKLDALAARTARPRDDSQVTGFDAEGARFD